MKALALFIFLLGCCFASNGQSYAIIKDKDGFVNVRKGKSINSQIVGKIFNNSVFGFDDEDKTEWVKIFKTDFHQDNGYVMEGYIHKSRIFPISKFESIKHLNLYTDSCIAFNDTIRLVVKSKLFNPKNHKLTFSKAMPNQDIQKELIKINDKRFWGTDGETPKKAISSIRLIKKGVPIIIPQNTFDDLFEPSFKSLKIFMGDNNTLFIEMDNSDGAGAYSIIFIIKNNKYYDRYIDNSNV